MKSKLNIPFTMVPNHWVRNKKIGPFEFRVLVILASYTQPAFASIPTIAEEGCLSQAQVYRALKSLRQKGFVNWVLKGRSNHYTLRINQCLTDRLSPKTPLCQRGTPLSQTVEPLSVSDPRKNNKKEQIERKEETFSFGSKEIRSEIAKDYKSILTIPLKSIPDKGPPVPSTGKGKPPLPDKKKTDTYKQ